ncbi:MAG: Uma2 family endonuclease [Terriglobia bacterium]
MSTVMSPPSEVRQQAAEVGEHRAVMDNVSWETYEGLLAALADSSAPRLTYDQGMLEIMSPLRKHEKPNRVLAQVVELVAEELGVECEDQGSTTFRRRELKQGVEPDSCFYLQNVERIRGEREIDLAVDPPPDLVIEVEITSPLVNKISIYAGLGVPEIWVTDGLGVRVLRLAGRKYRATEQSRVLPPLTASVLSEFLAQTKTMKTLAWRKMVRDWARERGASRKG